MGVISAVVLSCVVSCTAAFTPVLRGSLLQHDNRFVPAATRRGVSQTSMARSVCAVTEMNRTPDRRDFAQLLAGVVVAVAVPAGSLAKETETVKCRSVANRGASMGGTQCEGTKEVEFTRAFETTGTATKITGDQNKLSTYYSQIDAGYQILQDLSERWDQYVAAGDGDVIRRRLGTVGSKSPLHNIRKVFEGAVKVAASSSVVDPDALDELDESFNAALQGIAEVDYFLYSTAFVGTQEVAKQLRIDGKKSLENVLLQYKKFITLISPVLDEQAKQG